MELTQIEALAAVVRTGGFAAAARERGSAPSSITRAVAALEETLGVRLLERTTRQVSLTEAGAAFLARAGPALDELAAAREAAAAGRRSPAGLLRVSASTTFGQTVIAPRLGDFAARYPDVVVELSLSDAVVDLIADGIDLAVRHGALKDSALVAARLCGVRYLLAASPDYLAGAPALERPEDIPNHRSLAFVFPAFGRAWTFERGEARIDIEIAPTFRANNAGAIAAAARAGAGLALLADWTIADDFAAGRLVRALPKWSVRGAGAPEDAAISLVTPSRAFTPAKTEAFARFLRKIVRESAAGLN